ncbi:MAG: hypothetical protein AAFY34_14890 [Pseudomonadota bacterium]
MPSWIWILTFWIVFGILAFAFALAVQMRVIIGVILARALRARDADLSIPESRAAAVFAGHGHAGASGAPGLSGAIAHLQATYPRQLDQLRLARRVCLVTPIGIVLLIAVFRIWSG